MRRRLPRSRESRTPRRDDRWTVDAYGLPARRLGVGRVLAALLLVGALTLSAFAVSRARRVARVQQELATVRASVDALERRNAALATRVGATEQGLAEKRAGIAPLAKRVLRSVFTVEVAGSLGSGFVAWRESGGSYLVTAAHVVANADGPYVRVSRRGGTWTGEVVGTDRRNDLAVIRINGRPVGADALWQSPAATRVRAGDQLLLVGSPFGLEGTVTTGVVSRVTRKEIQTDAAANPGNSGGPAIDERGRLVGVLVAGGGENLNFAVPIRKLCLRLREC